MGYSRGTSNYPKRIILSDLTHRMTMTDLVAIVVETLRIESVCSLKKKFTELIHMNSLIVLYLNVNQVDSCYGCVYGLLT